MRSMMSAASGEFSWLQSCLKKLPEWLPTKQQRICVHADMPIEHAGTVVCLDAMLTTVVGSDEGFELTRGASAHAAARPPASATAGIAVKSVLALVDGRSQKIQGDKSFLDTGADLYPDDPKSAVSTGLTFTPLDAADPGLFRLRTILRTQLRHVELGVDCLESDRSVEGAFR